MLLPNAGRGADRNRRGGFRLGSHFFDYGVTGLYLEFVASKYPCQGFFIGLGWARFFGHRVTILYLRHAASTSL